ncbi:MAG TPA: protein TolR [Sphingopyxis sp.]|nr:protein TolR [Sphingopyxis sp.]
MGMTGPSSGGGYRRGRGQRRAPMADINVTPFVDVMLVLLIIFMVTAPLISSAVPIDLPDSRAKPMDSEEQEPLQLSINADNTVYLGETIVSEADLPARLEAIAAEEAKLERPRQIMLRADKSLDYGRVMKIMGELHRVGLGRIALITTGSDSPAAAKTSTAANPDASGSAALADTPSGALTDGSAGPE